MATITEDYCSKEIYRLLIEKGFNGEVHTTFDEEGYTQPSITLQMAMKWLREVYDIFIEISVDEMLKDEGYQWALYYNSTKEIRPYSGWGDSYEGACKAAIKYCLENLITSSSVSEQ